MARFASYPLPRLWRAMVVLKIGKDRIKMQKSTNLSALFY